MSQHGARGLRPFGRAALTNQSSKDRASYLELAGLRAPSVYIVRSAVAIVLAVCPSLVCASLAENSGRWELFERSGSIITAIGLMLASRRYIRYGVLELTTLRANNGPEPNVGEILEDILTAKLGLALSALGTVIWGWGEYLGWWSFSYLVVWTVFAVRSARRDFVRMRNSQAGAGVAGEASEPTRAGSLTAFNTRTR